MVPAGAAGEQQQQSHATTSDDVESHIRLFWVAHPTWFLIGKLC
jgi:hypothetical protein